MRCESACSSAVPAACDYNTPVEGDAQALEPLLAGGVPARGTSGGTPVTEGPGRSGAAAAAALAVPAPRALEPRTKSAV